MAIRLDEDTGLNPAAASPVGSSSLSATALESIRSGEDPAWKAGRAASPGGFESHALRSSCHALCVSASLGVQPCGVHESGSGNAVPYANWQSDLVQSEKVGGSTPSGTTLYTIDVGRVR